MARQTQWRDNHNGAANHWRGNQTARQSQWRGIIPSNSQTKTPKGRRAASGGLFLKAHSLQPIRPSLPSSWSGEVWRGNQSVRKPQARVPPLTAGGTPAPAWGAHRPPDPPSSGYALGLARVFGAHKPSRASACGHQTRSRCAIKATG